MFLTPWQELPVIDTFQCSECCAIVRLPLSPTIRSVTCPRCGDVSMITDGRVRRVYPALHMRPIGTPDGVVSKWMDGRVRPVAAGMYECRFRHLEPAVLPLYWDGACFREGIGGRRVQCVGLLAWRGWLA